MASHNGKYYKCQETKDTRNVKTLHSFGFVKQPPALSNSTGQDENNNEIISDSERRSDRLPEQVSDSASEIQIESRDASTPTPGSEECEAESVISPPIVCGVQRV